MNLFSAVRTCPHNKVVVPRPLLIPLLVKRRFPRRACAKPAFHGQTFARSKGAGLYSGFTFGTASTRPLKRRVLLARRKKYLPLFKLPYRAVQTLFLCTFVLKILHTTLIKVSGLWFHSKLHLGKVWSAGSFRRKPLLNVFCGGFGYEQRKEKSRKEKRPKCVLRFRCLPSTVKVNHNGTNHHGKHFQPSQQ